MYSFVLRHSLTFFIKQVFISHKLFKQIRHIYLFLCVSNLCFFFSKFKKLQKLNISTRHHRHGETVWSSSGDNQQDLRLYCRVSGFVDHPSAFQLSHYAFREENNEQPKHMKWEDNSNQCVCPDVFECTWR